MEIDFENLTAEIKQAVDTLIQTYGQSAKVYAKFDGSLVTDLDRQLQQGLCDLLARRYPKIEFLGEEMTQEAQHAVITQAPAYWCLDPLDGTSNFVHGIPFWAVSLALVRNTRVEYAVVIDPLRNECFSAVLGQGAWLNANRLRYAPLAPPLRDCIVGVDFKRLTPELSCYLVSNPPYRSQRNFGSCALEWCWIAKNRIQAYLHGGMKFWDYAAGLLILSEAGGHSSTLEGEPVFAPTLPKRSVVAAANEALWHEWRDYLNLARR